MPYIYCRLNGPSWLLKQSSSALEYKVYSVLQQRYHLVMHSSLAVQKSVIYIFNEKFLKYRLNTDCTTKQIKWCSAKNKKVPEFAGKIQFYLSPAKLWHNDVNVMPMRRLFVMLMMIMMKLTKRAKEMRKKERIWCWWWWWQQWLWEWKCLTLRPKQPFASEQCKSQRTFPTVTSISHWSSIQLFSMRSHKEQTEMVMYKECQAGEDQVISLPCRRPPAYELFSL